MKKILTPDPDGIIVKKIKTPTGVMVKIMAPVGVTVKIEVENYALPMAVETSASEISSKPHPREHEALYGSARFQPPKGRFFPTKGWLDGSPLQTTDYGELSVRQLAHLTYHLYAADELYITDQPGFRKHAVRLRWVDYFGNENKHEYRILRWNSFLSPTTPAQEVLESLQNPIELDRVKSNSYLDIYTKLGNTYVYKVESVWDRGYWGGPITRHGSPIEVTVL